MLALQNSPCGIRCSEGVKAAEFGIKREGQLVAWRPVVFNHQYLTWVSII